MTDKVFRLDAANRLTEMSRVGFVSEDIFQTILADHPAILGSDDGAGLLLIKREQPVADSVGGGGRWSLDHLYVDVHGIPILVEVKRATDTRARREVVAQMLDYAANGVAHWPLSQIIDAFSATCSQRGETAEQVLGGFLPPGADADAFWKSVETNLRAGRIRMLFVADEIPRELRRIVEFLNEQMRPAEVLAIQVEHYLGADGTRTLVPRLIGATERATSTKAVGGQSDIHTTEDWLERLAQEHGDEAYRGAVRAIDWFRSRGSDVGPTASGDAVYLKSIGDDGKEVWPFFIRHSTGGRLEMSLQYLRYRPRFASDEAREAALRGLQALPGLDVKSTGRLTGWPSFAVSGLLDDAAWEAFTTFASSIVDAAKLSD
jgi:hypothetical protein